MARKQQQSDPLVNESLGRAFLKGFWLPIRFIGRSLAWLAHRPPLQQIGHAFRWFFRLKPVRFIGRLLGLRFIRSSWQELKQVTWLSFRESRRLTVAVIIFSVIFGVLIAAVDFVLDKAFKQLLLK